MRELTRRRLLWLTMAVSAGYLMLTVVLAAVGALNAGWYLLGAGVYGAVLALTVVGFLTEEAPAPPLAQPAAAPAPATAAPAPLPMVERVVYTTPRGSVVELAVPGGALDYDIHTDGTVRGVAEVEHEVDTRGWPGAERPRDADLRDGLRRWGRLHDDFHDHGKEMP